MSILVILLTSHLVFGQSKSDNNTYTISKRLISIEDGLASHEVFCGLQDNAGFMWFGTRNGLNRYDGKNCLLFTRQRNDLQENKVVQLAKDDANNLFIEYGSTGFQLTTNGKVDVMNAETQEVKTLTAAFPNLPFKEQDVYWVSNDGTDQVSFLTAHPFRLWKYSAKSGFKLRYQIKDWNEKLDANSVDDYKRTGALCLFARGRALIRSTNQSTQYLISDDTVIAFKPGSALRWFPIGFTKQNDLLITYNTATRLNTFDVGIVRNKGANSFPVDATRFNIDSIKVKYWFQGACSTDGLSSVLYIGTDGLYLWNESTFIKIVAKSE